MNLSKLFGGEHPPTGKSDKVVTDPVTGLDARITFLEPNRPLPTVRGVYTETVKTEGVIVEERKIVAPAEFKMGGETVAVSGVGSEAVHRDAFHIKPTMQAGMKVEATKPSIAPASVTVSLDGGAAMEAPTVKDIDLSQRNALSALIKQAEDPSTPPHMRSHLQSQIIAGHSASTEPVAANTGPVSEEKPTRETPADEVVGSEKTLEKPAVENPFKEKDDLEVKGDPLSNEQKLSQLLQDIKTVPPKDRPAIMREIGLVKKAIGESAKIEEKRLSDKEDVGNKIIRSRGDAATAQAKKQELEARITDEKKKRADAGQPEEGAHLNGLEKRLKVATTKLTTAEQSYQDLTARFLALGGTQDEIEALIAANSDEKPVEKPLVGENEALKEELEAVGNEVADPVLGAMIAGTAVEALAETSQGQENTPEATQAAPTEIAVAAEQIENIEDALNTARTAYVKADIVNRNKIERLALHFPWLKNEKDVQKNPDLIQLREKYLAVKRAFQEQELKKLSDVPNEEALKKFLFENSFGEAINLDNEYQRVLVETRGLGGKILAAYEGMGNWYNGLGMKKKAIIGASLFAGSLALGATGLGIGVPAIVWLRRFMAGSGSAMKLDAITEKWQEGANAKKIDKHLDGAVEQARDLSPEVFTSKMKAFLALSEKGVDQELIKRRQSRAKRKWSARLAGAFGGLAISELVAFGFHHDVAEAAGAGVSGEGASAVGDHATVGASITEGPEGASLEQNTPGAIGAETGVPHEALDQVAGGSAEGTAGGVSVGEFPASHVVTAGDSSKGLWGVLEKSLPANMPEADKNAHVAALEKIIASKVAHMTPEMQAEYGFQGGNINIIQPGDTIQFNKLLTPEEWQNPLSVKIEDLPVSSAGVDEVVKATTEQVSRIDEHFLDGMETEGVTEKAVAAATEQSVGLPENLLEGVDVGGSNLLVETMPEDPTRSVLETGVDANTFRESLQNFRLGVLGTPETANWLKYNPIGHASEMMQVPMGDVIKAHESIVLSGSYDMNLPFHQSQIEKLYEMSTEAVKQYGASARPGKFETFERYTRRLIALGFQGAPKN